MAVDDRCETVTSGFPYGQECLPKALRDTDIQHIGIEVLTGNSGRMENDPGGVGAPKNAGVYHAPFQPETEGEVLRILPIFDGLSDAERRDRLIGMLDDVRRAYDSARIGRLELMVIARDNGLSCHEIGVVLGVTENAVRAQIRRTRAGAA